MAITLETIGRNAAANAVVDLIDAGTGAGYVTITTAADAVLATVDLNEPAFGDAATGVATADVDPLPTATFSDSGTAAKCKVYDGDDTLVFQGTVTDNGGTGDMKFDRPDGAGTDVVEGDSVSISSFTYTQPATAA